MPLESTSARSLPLEAGPADSKTQIKNVGLQERLFSLGAGGSLALAGLFRGRLSGAAAMIAGASLVYRGMSGHCHVYDALGINTASHHSSTAVPAQAGVHVEESIAINAPKEEVMEFWRTPEKLQQALRHVEKIEAGDEGKLKWTAKGQFGRTLQWETETLNERGNEMFAWKSVPGGDVEMAGSIRVQPLNQGRGTLMTITLKYNPPGGKLGDFIASLAGRGTEQQLAEDLRNVKRLLEAGEIPTIAGQPSGRASHS